MKPELTIIPSISIHPQQVNFYYQYHWEPSRPQKKDDSNDYFAFVQDDGTLFESKKTKYDHLLNSARTANGKVSKTAKKKIGRAVDYLMAVTSEKKITNRLTGRTIAMKVAFVTLTLPSAQMHDDREIINTCLNQFLIEIKKYYKVRNYIWRAEKQKNNNIHFHVLIDKFIPYQELRDRWNRIVEKLGYVTRYREEQQNWHKNGFRLRKNLLRTWPEKKQKEAYLRGSRTHWHSPNSTDIHQLRKIINLKSYITKYLTKNEQIQKPNEENSQEQIHQTGRIWGCNRELNHLKGARLDVDNTIQSELEKLEKDSTVYSYKGDYFVSYYIDWKKLPEKGCNYLFKQLAIYLHEVFDTPVQLETG